MSNRLTIGQLSKRIGLKPKTIRYYEQIGLISPERNPNGYRIFSAKEESNLLQIKRAQILGLSLKEIALILQDVQQGLCNTAKMQLKDLIYNKIEFIDTQIVELSALRSYLKNQLTEIENDSAVSKTGEECSCL